MAVPLATVDHTLFFVLGITLVVSAVALSAIGLKFEKFPPNRTVLFGVLVYFVALVAATVTFAVRNAQQEQAARDAEQASANNSSAGPATAPTPAGGGSTIAVSADPTGQLKFEQTSLTATAGKDTVDFTNKSPVGHNVQIQDSNGKVIGGTKTITGESTSTTVDLKPGKYTYFCSVPGHEQAGMKGTLTVN
jgi:plastocyanin